MWHEARKQEKLVRSKLVDNAKRHERRKNFYESIRRDPEEFMQIHGRRAVIHMDASVASAAEASNILRMWQVDPEVLIDRFDARSHLDYIPEVKSQSTSKQIRLDDVQELQCEYERYRILIFNDYLRVSEKSCLNQIAAKEFWPTIGTSLHRKEQEKKKKMAEKKAAIGFIYGDSDLVSTSGQKESNDYDSESSSDIEDFDEIDVKFDVEEITPEQGALLNKIGAKYNIGAGVFLKLLRLDYKEQDNNAQIKEIDKAKLALSGRQAKADRAILKRRRAMIVGKVTQNEEATTTLLSFLANTKKNVSDDVLYSSSESNDESVERTEFITCFGEDEDCDKNLNKRENSKNVEKIDDEIESSGVVQGPILPTEEYRRLLELKRRRSASLEDFREPFRKTRRRSRSPNLLVNSMTRISRSRDRYYRSKYSKSRSTSRHRKSRSRSRNDKTSFWSSSRRSYTDQSPRQRYNRKSCRSSSASSSSRLSVRNRYDNKNTNKTLPNRSRQSQSRSLSRSSAQSSSHESGSNSPLTIRSSMSDSEKEKLEIENRKRRIRRIKREMKCQEKRKSGGSRRHDSSPSHKKKKEMAKKLRQQMQKTLKKTAEQMKQEEEEKIREQIRERKEREEQLLEEARSLRIREREKRRQEDEKAALQRERERHHRRALDSRRSGESTSHRSSYKSRRS